MSGYVQIFAFLFNFNHAQTTCLSFSWHPEDLYYYLGGDKAATIKLGSKVSLLEQDRLPQFKCYHILGNRQLCSHGFSGLLKTKIDEDKRIHSFVSVEDGCLLSQRHDHIVQFVTLQYYLCSCFGQCCKPIKTNMGASRWAQRCWAGHILL